MLDPRALFDDFQRHLPHLTARNDADVEDQFLDRKEACKADPSGTVSNSQVSNLRDQVVECISAFANTNHQGGLVVVGISKTGEVRGINHLSDQQRNSITNFNVVLRNHAVQVKLVDCTDLNGGDNKLILIFVPYTRDGICETAENRPKSWRRNGSANVFLDDRQRAVDP